ncbi:hypothetical protein KVM30_02570 [Helicobacter pylori]|nr:hypothetical protein KVM30_02570 [Helicobacter pylori]
MPRYFTKGGVLEPVKDYDTWFNSLKCNVKTSDDTFTPPLVYEEILKYINEKIIPIDSIEIHRPFYPGGDYKKDIETYNEKSVVIDNPPFSITSEILDFYTKNNIKFFIFTNGLTVFHSLNTDLHLLCPYVQIEYENGTKLTTCFIHNLLPKGVTISGELRDRLDNLPKSNKKEQNKYSYPKEVLSVANSLELAKRIKGEHTIYNYKGITGLSYKGKQKKVFCKAMLLSKSEQEKINKIRAECGLIKTPLSIQNKKKKTLPLTTAIVSLFTIITALLPLPTLIPITLSAVAMLTSLITATKIAKQTQKIIKQKNNDDGIIKFELSEKQKKYMEELEN